MGDFKWIHELIFGALVGNILLGLSFLKFMFKIYKQYDAHMHRHRILWLEHCKKYKLYPGKEFEYDRANQDSTA